MTNPFEDENADYVVLVNQEGQHSLWPSFAATPVGWDLVFGEATRKQCLEYVEKAWTDMRLASLAAVSRDD